MADLVTHLATVLLPAAFVRTRYTAPLALGVALPDLAARVPAIVAQAALVAGAPLPDAVVYAWDVAHVPAGVVPVAVIVGQLVRPVERLGFTLALLAGCAAHLALDLLQDHHGVGYRLLFPLSPTRFEIPLMGSEATVWAAGPLALATALAWAWRLRRDAAARRRDR